MDSATLVNRLRGLARRVFFWQKPRARSEEKLPELGSDHALVLSVVSAERVPRFKQFRHLFRLLSARERRVFLTAFAVAIIALCTAAGIFVSSRLATVPIVGGTFTEAVVGDPKYLNPLDAMTNDVDRDLVRLLYSGLFRFDGTDVVPDIAESYAWSDDRKTLTVQIKKNATFHDGERVTPEDVRFTIESAQDPARKSPLLSTFRGVTVSAKNESTVEFQLQNPDAFFLQKLTVGILPANVWQGISAANARLSDLNVKPVGSGPYRIKSFLRDNLGAIHSYTLERFENYYGTRPFIKTIVMQFFTDRGSAVDALKSELVDAVAFVDPTDAEKFRTSGRQHEIRLQLPETTTAYFNLKDPTLSDQDVRQALALAVNTPDVLAALGPFADPISGPYPFLQTTTTRMDLERARKMLDEAGWIVPQDGNIRVMKPKKPASTSTKKTATTTETPTASSTELTITISFPDDPKLAAVADVLKRDWSLLGAKVVLDQETSDDLMRKTTRDRDLQVMLFHVLLGPDQDLFPFWFSGQAVDRGLNFSNLKDRTVDDALDQLKNATSTESIQTARDVVATAINKSVPALFFARPSQSYFISSKINGLPDAETIVTPAERFATIDKWYLKTGLRWK